MRGGWPHPRLPPGSVHEIIILFCLLEITPTCPKIHLHRSKRQVEPAEESISFSVENGVASCPSRNLNPANDEFIVGTVCQLICNEGFLPSGYIRCLEEINSWSHFSCGRRFFYFKDFQCLFTKNF